MSNSIEEALKEADFVFLLSILLIDRTDNLDYFLYKFNLSKKVQKRLKNINDFYKDSITSKSLSEKKLNKLFYYKGKEFVIDILSYKIFTSKKIDNRLLDLIDKFKAKILPSMPIGAKVLIEKYDIPQGKNLGTKLKIIEEEWVNNDFQLTDKQINKILDH